jgi:cupin superfamily acireductone dioxygenase involved in methionine salvage
MKQAKSTLSGTSVVPASNSSSTRVEHSTTTNSSSRNARKYMNDHYHFALSQRNIESGKGAFGNGDNDVVEIKNMRYVTINCQINDGIFIFEKALVGSWAVLKFLFAKSSFKAKDVIAILNSEKKVLEIDASQRSQHDTTDSGSCAPLDDIIQEIQKAKQLSPKLHHVNI